MPAHCVLFSMLKGLPYFSLTKYSYIRSTDSFFQAKVARGYDMYECLVEGYPLSKKRREKLQRQHVPRLKHEDDKEAASSDAMEVEDKSSVDGLVSALSTLTTSDTTPSNVSFGRRHGRGLTFVPRSVHKEKRTESSSAPGPTN
ncbi:unnamed protein product [Arabidopsis arenosa]|uniref:Uncharacterized protein n=1 Tax=Arabidopsis arenosa TaxID=38785 RepID=A0A8S2AKL5_ARAAE|nr:unnamed protein product [Arabidopsis arenosa]